MKITCEIKNQVPYSSFNATGLFWEGGTLTLFFGQCGAHAVKDVRNTL